MLNLSLIYFLSILISKEIFSYDSEKVVILCILFFLIISYYQLKESIYIIFESRVNKLKEEFTHFLILKIKLEKNIKTFWFVFLDLEDKFVTIFLWIKTNIKNILKQLKLNRIFFLFHLSKDHLNIFFKENLTIFYKVKNLQTKNILYNFYLLLSGVVELPMISLNKNLLITQLENAWNSTNSKLTINFDSLEKNNLLNSHSNNYNIILDTNKKIILLPL